MSEPIDSADDPPGESTKPEREILSGDRDALVAIDSVVAAAKRRLLIFDLSLKPRGFNNPQRCAVLRTLLLAARTNEIRIALHEVQGLESDCPRLIALAQQFPSSIRIHQTIGVARTAQDPFIIADEAAYWHKLHYQHPRSVLATGDIADTLALAERFEEIWESSEPAPVGGVTGL
jgi:hypothetical protein